MSFDANIRACHACPLRQGTCAGPCPCTVDGRDIIDHAKAHDCPRGNYAARGLGDVVARVLSVTGVAGVVKAVAGKDCGCAKRQARLNTAVPFR